MKKILYFFIIFSHLLFLTSCSFVEDPPVEEQVVYVSDNFESSCEFDANEFKNILEKNITSQISCLESNFNQFTKYVKRENKKYVTENELKAFIRKFFPSDSQIIIDSLELFFKLNMLVFNDRPNRISTKNIRPIFDLFRTFNREGVVIYHVMKNVNSDNFSTFRDQLNNSITRFSKRALATMFFRRTGSSEIDDLTDFINDIKDKFNFEINEDTINALLLVKKLVLGGQKNVLTSRQLRNLIKKSPRLTMVAFDLFLSKSEIFDSQNDYYNFLSGKINDIHQLLFNWDENEPLFTTSDLINAAQVVPEDIVDINKYDQAIVTLKEKVFGGYANIYTLHDVHVVLSYAHLALEGLSVFESYRELKDKLKNRHKGFWQSQEKFNSIVNAFAKKVPKITALYDIIPAQLNIRELCEKLNEDLEGRTDDGEPFFDMVFIDAILSVKKLLLGGDKNVLQGPEFSALVAKSPILLMALFDISNVTKDDFHYSDDLYTFYLEKLKSIQGALFKDHPELEPIFSVQDIMKLGDYILEGLEVDKSDKLQLSKFEKSIKTYLNRIFKVPADLLYLRVKEINTLLRWGDEALTILYFNNITYDHFEDRMKDPTPISDLDPVYLERYSPFTDKQLRQLQLDFLHIAKNYYFFRDPDIKVQYYKEYIRRTKNGFTEVAVLKWVANIILRAYGTPTPGEYQKYGVDIDQVWDFLSEAKEILVELGLWTTKPATFARNMLLLADLFQYTSNGSLTIGLDEGTEFFAMIFSATKVGGELLEALKTKCQPYYGFDPANTDSKRQKPGYMSHCYRKYFYNIVFEKYGYKKYFTKLYEYISSAPKTETANFLRNVENFVRDVRDDSIPVSSREITLILGAILNIESTFIRFDTNDNNIIDNDELQNAFKVYKDTIIMVADLDGDKYAKSVFLYMVKYMKIPTAWEVFKFHNFGNHDTIVAKRLNIACILYFLVMQAEQQANQNNKNKKVEAVKKSSMIEAVRPSLLESNTLLKTKLFGLGQL